jgi:hypothetical protein
MDGKTEQRPATYVQHGDEKADPAEMYRQRMGTMFGPNWRVRFKATMPRPTLQRDGGKE